MLRSSEQDQEVILWLLRLCSSHQSCTTRTQHRLHRKERLPRRNLSQCWVHSLQSSPQHISQVPRSPPRFQVLRHQRRNCQSRLEQNPINQGRNRHFPHKRNRRSFPQKQSYLPQGFRRLYRQKHNVRHVAFSEVTGLDGNKETITAKNTIIATGSEPTPFPNLPFDEKIIISSTGALSLPKIPKDLIVIGGGVIGLEMASVYQRFGTNVTVVEFMDEIVPSLDKEIAKTFHKILTKQGVKILTSHKVLGGKNNGDHAEIRIQPVKGGDEIVLKGDHVLVATGRRPHTDKLAVEKAGVKVDDRGRVVVNDNLETNVDCIHAIGDVVRGAMLAHKAEEEGIFVAEKLAGKHPHINYLAIPGVIYTYPEVASVGYTEE